jgi:hypothetical protein
LSERRIYSSNRHADLFAIVDEIDYHWALQWQWSPKWSRGGTKVYLRRVYCISKGSIIDEEGRRIRIREQTTIFLHREITWRAKGPPPPDKPLSDHRNGDELDCRRQNLRWADHGMNARNINQNSASIRRRLELL